jgi:hypothetical protein
MKHSATVLVSIALATVWSAAELQAQTVLRPGADAFVARALR